MLDTVLLRTDPARIQETLRRRGEAHDLDALIGLDERVRELKTQVDTLRAERNTASKSIGQAKGRGEDASAEMEAVRELGDRLDRAEELLREHTERFQAAMLDLPNIVQDDVPVGGEDEGVLVREVGAQPVLADPVRDHLDLGTALGIIDMERGARTSGSRFAYLLGDSVRLQYALVQYAISVLSEAGFIPVVPPVLVREGAMEGTGFFPAELQSVYPVDGDDLFLVGTSEVPLAAFHADEILDAADLPLRYAGISSCFRREAGTAGKDTRGIFRVHQFDKVEMFSFVAPERSLEEHEHILAQEERIVSSLGLHYRVMNIAAGDLGASASKKYDIEVWLPGQHRYRELTSCSNCTDYQARRLKARYRVDGKVAGPVHTLNGTAIAIGRMLVALMENHQQPDGTVAVPEVLHAFGAPKTLQQRG